MKKKTDMVNSSAPVLCLKKKFMDINTIGQPRGHKLLIHVLNLIQNSERQNCFMFEVNGPLPRTACDLGDMNTDGDHSEVDSAWSCPSVP